MPFVYSSFTDHLTSLPADNAHHGDALRAAVELQIRRPSNADLSAFLFLPDQTDHRDHEDAAQVFAQAVEQMYGPKPRVGDEIPLLFIGYHAMNRLSGRRTAQGLLLTDQALYVQDDFTVLSAAPPLAQGHALGLRADDADAFVSMLLGHAASDNLLDPANPKLAKKMTKVVGKFQMPADEPLQFALVDFPLFGGPYGLALTATALYSKELMEGPVRIALERLDPRSLQLSEKGNELLNDQGIPLQPPTYANAELKASFIELLKQEVQRLQASA